MIWGGCETTLAQEKCAHYNRRRPSSRADPHFIGLVEPGRCRDKGKSTRNEACVTVKEVQPHVEQRQVIMAPAGVRQWCSDGGGKSCSES